MSSSELTKTDVDAAFDARNAKHGSGSLYIDRSTEQTMAGSPADSTDHLTKSRNASPTNTIKSESSSKYDHVPPVSAWKNLFMHDVAQDTMLEAQLLALTVATGIQDAASFTTFSVFTSKQTGNTLFLALYAFRHPVIGAQIEQSVIVSLCLFVAGAALFGHLGRWARPRRRVWLLATNTFQTILLLAAAAIRHWARRVPLGQTALAIIALMSFASSGQIGMAVGVGRPELNTTMITGSLIQLSNDPKVFHWNNPARNRRALFYLSLLVGCFIGSAALLKEASLALLVASLVKAAVTVSFAFNKGLIPVQKTREEDPEHVMIEDKVVPMSSILWGD